jgi:hypothetical protein
METATNSPKLKFENVVLARMDRGQPDIEAQCADFYTLNHDGLLQVAQNPTALQLIDELEHLSRSFCHQGDQDVGNRTGTFSIM